MEGRDTGVIKSVIFSTELIFALAKLNRMITPSELGVELGIGKVKAYRYLNSLKEGGLLYQNQDTGKYGLALVVASLAKAALENSELNLIARPIMKRLSEKYGQTVLLHVWDRGEVVVTSIYRSQNAINIHSEVGTRMDPWPTASGRMFLSCLPEDELAEYLSKLSKGESKRIVKHLNEVRHVGFSLLEDAMIKGISGISAPVRSYTGKIEANLTLVGTTITLRELGYDVIARTLVESANEISVQIGNRKKL